jgi:hypothetical protein
VTVLKGKFDEFNKGFGIIVICYMDGLGIERFPRFMRMLWRYSCKGESKES